MNKSSINIACLSDFEQFARVTLDKRSFDYIEGGADDEQTIKFNVDAFKRYNLVTRVLRNVSIRDTSTTILGFPIPFPVCIAPTGYHGLATPDGEIATARGAEKMKTCYTMSFASNRSMREVSAAAPGGLRFFQLYNCRNRSIIGDLIRIAEEEGFQAFVVTVDLPLTGNRLRDARNKFIISLKTSGNQKLLSSRYKDDDFEVDASITPEFVRWIKSTTKLPIIVKGVLTADDATLAVECGASGVLVSNHGGRQLDCVPATLDVLEEIVKAVAGRCEVYLDGGVRKGTDVLKALALGARAVFIGRPVIYALAYNGAEGVEQMLQMLQREFSIAMAFTGCSKVGDINRTLLKQSPRYFTSHI